MEADLETVKAIMEGKTKVKTFDFDGQKYSRENIYDINDQLNAEILAAKRKLTLHDQHIFRFFYEQAAQNGQENDLTQEYEKHFAAARTIETDVANYNRIMEELQLIFHKEMSFQAAQNIVDQILIFEKPVKERLQFILTAEDFQASINPTQRQQLEAYLSNQKPYFVQPNFDHEAIGLLTEALNTYIQVAFDWNFKQKKAFLEKQLYLNNFIKLKPENMVVLSEKTLAVLP